LQEENPSFEIGEFLEKELQKRHDAYILKTKNDIVKREQQESKPLTGGVDDALGHVEQLPRGRYVLTCAQNNTEVDSVALGALQEYCAINDAVLLVAKFTYNKNGFQQSQDVTEGIYYAPEITPYIVEGQVSLGGVHFIAQANVIPTAKNPLSGFEGITPQGVHVVIPASKIALNCTASLKGAHGKILLSTGTITKRNYILRKAGAVASSDHNIGALFVDTTEETPVFRQLEIMQGARGFYDEGIFYERGAWVSGMKPAALQFGDIHAEKMEDQNLEKCKSLILQYKPENVILHDVMDFSSRNHHNVKDCTFIFQQHTLGNTVENDILLVADVIGELANVVTGGAVHIIESNHDLAINTWLKNADFKTDPHNARVYLRCMSAWYDHLHDTPSEAFNMLAYCMREFGDAPPNVIYHETDESLILAGVEMGQHGHTGTNGSRGSPAQFRKLGIALNTGHTHTPSIMGACYTAGVAGSLEMGYNIGASSWKLANVLTWPNGQRQIIFM
jgi:hypothetical protein